MKFIRLIIIFVMLAIMGIVLLVGSIKDKAELAKPRGDLTTMKADDFYAGRFVEGTIDELWDNFADMEESDTIFGVKYNTKVTARYFAMPLPSSYDDEDLKFVALAIRDSGHQRTADKMVDETVDYFANGKELPVWTTMRVEGKVTKLTGEGLKIFKEYFEEIGGGSENVVAYTINMGNTGNGTTGMIIFSIILTVVGLGGTAFFIVRKVLSGR